MTNPAQVAGKLHQILSEKISPAKPQPAPAAAHTISVQMPADVYELTKAMSVNLSLDHPVLLEMLMRQMGEQVSVSLAALVQARRAQQQLDKLKDAYGSTISQARTNLHSLLGERAALAL